MENIPEDSWGEEILGKSSELETRVILSLLMDQIKHRDL